MRKNTLVEGTNRANTPNKGESTPGVNMPSNNHGTFPVNLGAGQSSQFGKRTGPSTKTGGVNQSSTGGKANMAANNTTDKAVVLGHTKHGVGQVPGYLKGRQ